MSDTRAAKRRFVREMSDTPTRADVILALRAADARNEARMNALADALAQHVHGLKPAEVKEAMREAADNILTSAPIDGGTSARQ